MKQYSAIDTLEAIVDGDTIVPGMGVSLPNGVGRTQYWNPSTEKPTPDYTQLAEKIIIYPKCYSSGSGKFVVPDKNTEQWYVNNIDSNNAAILDAAGGSVKDEYAEMYEKTTYTVNNQTFPALKIIGNFASTENLDDVVIYCKAEYSGIEVSCHVDFGVKESTGSSYDILINCVNDDGVNDTVIDNSAEYLVLTAQLQDNGETIAASGKWGWYRSTPDGLVDASTVDGATLSNSNRTLTLRDAAIEGTEEYFAQVEHNNVTYRKGIQVCDTHDPYYVDLGRSTNTNLIRSTEAVTYTPKVYKRSDNSIQQGWTFAFAMYANHDTDTPISTSTGTSFTVPAGTVNTYGQLCIHVTATLNE